MSYPAACRAYSRQTEELRRLVLFLKNAGINTDLILKFLEEENHQSLIQTVLNNPEFSSLIEAAQHWEGSFINMKEEEVDWIESLRPDSPPECTSEINWCKSHYPGWSEDGMYQGFDDWNDYCDAHGIE
eukprot:gene13967-29732_t